MFGIVTTISLRAAPTTDPLESFFEAHAAIGFEIFFVFLDDPEADLPPILNRSDVVAWRRADSWKLYSQCSRYSRYEHVLSDVSSRQILNAEVALEEARKRSVRWLVHLDLDELFFTRGRSIRNHFESLDADGICQMTYPNHEGVPEADVQNYFRDVTLFRRHQTQLPLTNQARVGLSFWLNRTAHQQYFLFYDNGKSAVRVDAAIAPKNQHTWEVDGLSCQAFADTRNLQLSSLRLMEDPCILHFPVCGEQWFMAKYCVLGHFADTWAGGVTIPPCLHLDAREAAVKSNELERAAALRTLFQDQILLRDSAEAERQEASGVCFRVSALAEMLGEDTSPGIPQPSPTSKTSSEQDRTDASIPMEVRGVELSWVVASAVKFL